MRASASPAMITFDAAGLTPQQSYRLLAGAVTPRPIAWVSTLGPGGAVNLAPFSSYTFLAYDPPLVAISVGPGTAALKDTLANARRNGEFVVNSVTPELVRPMAESSRRYPTGMSEAEDLAIPLSPCRHVAVPRVAASPLGLECVVHNIIDLDDADAHRLLIGRVVAFHIAEAIWTGDRIDPLAFASVGRIGGPLYVRPGEMIRVEPTQDDRFTTR
jgi:flavin reductase (DIM6/NTAB) family NADH-FMN oxidoreductase RutF